MTVKQQPNLPFSACGTPLFASPTLLKALVWLDVFVGLAAFCTNMCGAAFLMARLGSGLDGGSQCIMA